MFNFGGAVYPILFSTLKADPEWLHQGIINFLGCLEDTEQQTLTYWIRQKLEQSLCLLL
jgi:dihydroorotate dehydrogenase